MRRSGRGTRNLTGRGRNRALAVDAGASTLRLWTPEGGLKRIPTLPGKRRHFQDRSNATGVMIEDDQGAILQYLPYARRWRRRAFPVTVAVPALATAGARRRAEAAATAVNNGGPVVLMEAPLAAAIGANVDIAGTTPRIVLDVGVFGSEAAIVADGRIVEAMGCRTGCYDIERVVLTAIGSSVKVNRAELLANLNGPISAIVNLVQRVAERGNARLETDVLRNGVVVVGGGGSVSPLIVTLGPELGTRVTAVSDPRHAVIRGLREFVAEASCHPRFWMQS